MKAKPLENLNGDDFMSENYVRETNNKANNKNCKNKNSTGAENVKSPMSKQGAAQHKAQNCD